MSTGKLYGIMANVDKGRSKWEDNSQGKSAVDIFTVVWKYKIIKFKLPFNM